jgi:hypothetical protein
MSQRDEKDSRDKNAVTENARHRHDVFTRETVFENDKGWTTLWVEKLKQNHKFCGLE